MSKASHRREMMQYFKRDLHDAQNTPCILGVKISARTDLHWAYQPCRRGAEIVGVYLPDEVPLQYPTNCPDHDACCCTLREFVLTSDDTEDERYLRARMIQRGITPPPSTAEVRPVTEAEQEKIIKTAQQGLAIGPDKYKPMWRFVLGLFSKKG